MTIHNKYLIKSQKKDKSLLAKFLRLIDKNEFLYCLLILSFILNFILLWSHFKFMSTITAEEPVCAIEELVEEKANELYCKEYHIVKRQDGSLVVTKIKQ
ncbi:MAG: hypothetical protein QXX12_01805 [Nanopusillaceae archaeon]